jgi:hypothetical protein
VSAGGFADINFCQFGAPLNNSPSHQTVPASNASRAVADIDGSKRRYFLRNGRVMRPMRRGLTFSRSMRPAGTDTTTFHHPAAAPNTQYAGSRTSSTAVAAARPARR